MTEDRRVASHQRRSSDELLETLINEVQGFRQDISQMREEVKPLNVLARQVYAAKMAAIWGFGLLAIIGGVVTWILNVKEHVDHIRKVP